MDKKILVSKSISKRYNEKLILDNINFEMFSGEILGLLGPSGIGKTTLLNILVGLGKETSGEIINYHNNKIGYVSQEDRLLNWLTLFENIKLIKEDIDEKTIWENLSLVGLKDYYNYFPKELSGGMRQRGSIARALTFAGNIMLFDEPFKSLDIKLRFELLDLMRKLSELGASLVNGMSYSTRSGKFSNSAIVVGISEKDYGDQIFSGMYLQEKLEKKNYEIVGTYGAIYQNVLDFMKHKKTTFEIESSYKMKLFSYDINNFFPNYITRNLQSAFENWSKNNLFISEKVNLIGPETRTSAPVKILRDLKGESISIKGLFPIGEGAGYAGGIMSAAVDGIKIVDLAFSKKIF